MDENIKKILYLSEYNGNKSGTLNKINEEINTTSNNDLESSYIDKINEEYDNLIEKFSKAPNFDFILGDEIIYNNSGIPNKCEANTYNFIKDKLNKGENYYYPVGGFHFVNKSLHPVEHWWVYDSRNKKHIEVTNMFGDKPFAYAGVINYEINEKILNTSNTFDINFFKGGYIFFKYIKNN